MHAGRYKFQFRYPPPGNVVILNARSTEYLVRELQVLGVIDYVPSERILILRPMYLFWLLKFLRKTERIAANLAAFIRSSRIPVLVTMDFRDVQLPTANSRVSLLEEVSRIVPQTVFFSVQHGQELRRFQRVSGDALKRVTLLCFGNWAANNFPSFGRREYRYIPVGSVLNSSYLQCRPKTIQKNTQLTFISTVKNDSWWGSEIGERRLGYEELVTFVRTYCNQNRITPLVALTTRRDQNPHVDEAEIERNWFSERLDEPVLFTNPELVFGGRSQENEAIEKPKSLHERFSSYFACDEAHVTVGMSSTSLWESFARGNKVLAVNPTENPIYDFPIDGCWSLRQPTYEGFSERLSMIFAMDDIEWKRLTESAREQLIRSDDVESAGQRVRAIVCDAVAKHEWRKTPLS